METMRMALVRANLKRALELQCRAARQGMEFLVVQAEVTIKVLNRELAELKSEQ